MAITIDTGFATGLFARTSLGGPYDISAHYSLRMWVKVDTGVAAGVLGLVLDDNANCASPIETVSLPGLSPTGGWARVQIKPSDPSILNGVRCIGLSAASDPGALVIKLDDIEAPAEVTELDLVLAAPDGGAIDLRPTVDTDDDGLLSDEASIAHSLVITVTSDDQLARNIAWSTTELGKGDRDTQLEKGERVLLTIDLQAMDPLPTEGATFTLSITPQGGAGVTKELTLPRSIDPFMVLP